MRITRFILKDTDKAIHFLPVVGYSYSPSIKALFFGWLILIWIVWFKEGENEDRN